MGTGVTTPIIHRGSLFYALIEGMAPGTGGFEMNFFRSFSAETHIAFFIACVFLFFFVSSAVSLVEAAPSDSHSSMEYAWVESQNYDSPLSGDSPSSGLLAPPPPDAGGPVDDSPDAAGPNENPTVLRLGLWDIVAEFFATMLMALPI